MKRLHRKNRKQKKIIISLSVFLVLFLSVGYAAFQTNISLKAKGNIKEKPISISDLIKTIITTGDGLYSDSTETGRYIYRGANPNNYITLGSDTYRIISVESDGTLKVIKNGSIGSKTFDPGYSTNISGVTDASSVTGTRYSSASTDYCYQNSGTASNYYGCKVWGSETTMLDSNGKNVTTMPREVGGTSYNLPSTEAYLNTYLNNDWYNSLSSTVQSKIVTHLFNVGVVKITSGQTLATDISQEQAYKWKGKVGLMSASDYVKSNSNTSLCGTVYANSYEAGNYSTCKTTSWIFAGPAGNYSSWTISPSSSSFANYEFLVGSGGNLNTVAADDSYGVAPVLYLSSDITLTGEGTEGSPYTLN